MIEHLSHRVGQDLEPHDFVEWNGTVEVFQPVELRTESPVVGVFGEERRNVAGRHMVPRVALNIPVPRVDACPGIPDDSELVVGSELISCRAVPKAARRDRGSKHLAEHGFSSESLSTETGPIEKVLAVMERRQRANLTERSVVLPAALSIRPRLELEHSRTSSGFGSMSKYTYIL